MSLVIQKFGGTSLATHESRERVVLRIEEATKKYDQVVVVVSAMGRLGAPYATDTLLSLLETDGRHVDDREMDMLIACGEIITTVVLSNALGNKGMKAQALTGGQSGIRTSSHFLEAHVDHVDTTRIKSILAQGNIPVVAGFQGMDAQGDTTTLGRGGSDTSAALMGEALSADVIEIFTDVDGIMTADPIVCKSAKLINHISYNELFQMADGGAKVIHPRAVEVARRSGIPLMIKNTFSDAVGTTISHFNYIEKPITVNERIITSIAHRSGRIQFLVEGDIDDEIFFNDLAAQNVSIDIINIFPGRRVFTTESTNKDKTIKLIEAYDVSFSYIDNCCKITVVGEKMTGVPGVMAKIISSLSKVKVQILQTADSLSTIACLIHDKDLEMAVFALHETFGLHDTIE